MLALHGNLGLTWDAADRVRIALGVGWSGGLSVREVRVTGADGAELLLDEPPANGVPFGAVQAFGYRPLLLLQLHVADRLSLDAYATWAVNVDGGDVRDRYLAGFTWVF